MDDMTKPIVRMYLITFLIVLPLTCFNLRHSIFYTIHPVNVVKEMERLAKEDAIRLAESQRIISLFNQSLRHERQSEPVLHSEDADIGLTVVTVSRNTYQAEKTQYLTQVVGRLLFLLNTTKHSARKYGIFLCNVDQEPETFDEFQRLRPLLPYFIKFEGGTKYVRYFNIFEKEKADYVYCLEKALAMGVSHAFLIEDDAYPHDHLFPVLERILHSLERNSHDPYRTSRNVTYVKFYHPERLLGFFSLEWERLPELISASLVVGSALTFLYLLFVTKRRKNVYFLWLLWVLYSCLVALFIGRVNLLELRRFSAQTYQVSPAASCCTPAMLFPKFGGRQVSKLLKTVLCRKGYGKDMALEDIRRREGFKALMVQPNLFKHIGSFSSIRRRLINPYAV